MKTIPSLVASSTVGIATAGLALGKPDRSSPIQSSSKRRKTVSGANPTNIEAQHAREKASLFTRPGTSSNVISRDTSLSRPTPVGPLPDAQPLRPTTANPIPSSNARYESPSSSTRRRLSSVGPDSPSITFSNGSRAPILPGSPGITSAQLPPNKLVKRAPSSRNRSGTVVINQEPRPVFRRPATSHQRRATLQQCAEESTPPLPDLLPVPPPRNQTKRQTPPSETPSEPRTSWIPFFQSRPTKLTKDKGSAKSGEGGAQGFQPTSRRVTLLDDDVTGPTLLKPRMISTIRETEKSNFDEASLPFEDEEMEEAEAGDPNENKQPTPEVTSFDEQQKRPRRSLSFHFSQPTTWIARSGSLRVEKRAIEGRSGGKRNSSAPISTLPGRNVLSAHGPKHHPPLEVKVFQDTASFASRPDPSRPESNDSMRRSTFQSRPRNLSSPLPPLTRLSSFNVDLARLGLPSPSSPAPQRSPSSPLPQGHARTSSVSSAGYISPTTTSYFGSINSKPRTSDIADRTSTLIGSDSDTRGFTTGDEDEMDLQSDTVYDSIRTGATSSIRSYTTPLESMFDDSPQSANSNNAKSKRLSVHELVGGQFHEGNKIVEEDEDMSTPVKGSRSLQDGVETPIRSKPDISVDTDFESTPKFFISTKDYSRLSLDDEEDEDWTRDDENMDIMALSPPSNSINLRRASPSLRTALADVTHTSSTNGKSAPTSERPKSNLFDWSEPSIVEKMDHKGNMTRPRTAYSNQVTDGRGGRAVGRKGPSALHIRSQSVPVVPDGAGHREHLTPKFGTWGLGAKGVSEDWDGDFEFDNSDSETGDVKDTKKDNKNSMVVPLAIQESQANVVGHVGQIREFCLLVEDLKRLRILGREKELLDGTAAPLWKEAEGIIALAVPDEEDLTLSAPRSPSVTRYDYEGDEKLSQRNLWGSDTLKSDNSVEAEIRNYATTSAYDTGTVRRRHSVFSPEDDIFGTGAAAAATPAADNVSISESLTVPASSRSSTKNSSTEVARSVMETMHQYRSASDPMLSELTSQSANKMPFDTTSLRDLVHRASVLTRTLAELIRKADGTPQSPDPVPQRESSPAFTRVFADPMIMTQMTMPSRQQQIPRSQSNNSVLSGSIDASPRRLAQHIHMMAVS
ncbi:hypothetical protein B7463_g56, partial [Scytalidium lignicola]